MVVDAFIFYNELELLLFRLKELNDCVDYFVLVEAKKTHSGNEKELYFENNKHLFKEYSSKIIHVIMDDLYDTESVSGFKDIDEFSKNSMTDFKKTPARIREEFHRNGISIGLNRLNLNDNDIVIISDADEIINPNIILEFKQRNVDMLAPEQDFYFYNLTYKYPKIWTFPKILKYKKLKELTPEDVRLSTKCDRIQNGGWHFSYFFGSDNIKDKIKNFSHQEFNNEHFTNDDYIQNCIKNGKYIFSDVQLEHIDIQDNTSLPKNYNLLLNKKHCFLITSYCDTSQKVDILKECIKNLKSISNNDICVHAHYPLSEEIQKSGNYYVYDSSNPILKYPEKYITWWRTFANITMHIYKDDYGYTVLQQWKRGFQFLKNLYDNIIIINYDAFITRNLLDKIENKSHFDGSTFLHENGNTITPLLSINTKTSLFDKISVEEYKNVNGFAENFAEYIFRDSNSYRFKFNEYKNDYYTSFQFEGDSTFKDNKLTQHNSPYDIFNFNNFEIFLGEKDNSLHMLIYNFNEDLNVKVIYKLMLIYDNILHPNFTLIDLNISFNNLEINEFDIFINGNMLKFDKEVVNFCKIIL
jgi:beta-1,4-mannosyl-glycoprotein beta-1,4-N-acetylglucosaminyltransferase